MRRAEELSIELSHLVLAAKAWGDPALPPMLALHGWLDNAGSFDRIAPLLAEDRRIVALDLPGHGRSQHRPPGARYHFVDYFDEIVEVFDHFGWERAGLLGHSLGGAIASLFAAACPERVDELVLIEALGPLTVAPDAALRQLRRGLDERVDAAASPRVHADENAAALLRQRVNGLSEEAARILVARGIRPVEGGVVWSSDPRLLLPSLQRYTEAEILAMLGAIRAPAVLLVAEPEHPLIGTETMRARIAEVDGIEVVRVAGNHHLHLENPEPAAAAIRAFLARTTRTSERAGA